MTRRATTTPGTNAGSFAPSKTAEADVDLVGPDTSDWRDQPVQVEGRQFTLADVYGGRLFHGSPHPVETGATLEPGRAEANYPMSSPTSVSITSGADIARHWASEAASGKPYYVYEVEPIGPVRVWRAMLANRGRSVRLQEGRVHSARIVRRIDLADAANYEHALRRGEDPLALTDGDPR